MSFFSCFQLFLGANASRLARISRDVDETPVVEELYTTKLVAIHDPIKS